MMPPPSVASRNSGFVDLIEFLRRRYLLIVFGLGLGLILAAVYCVVARAGYESSAEIVVMRKNAGFPAERTDGPVDAERASDTLATHAMLIRSPRVVDDAVRESSLASLPGIQAAAGDRAAEYIIAHLVVVKGGEGAAKSAQVLDVSFRHSQPDECSKVLSAVLDSYARFLSATFRDVSSEAAKLIARAKDELAAELEREEQKYFDFVGNLQLPLTADHSSNLHAIRLEQIETARIRAQLDKTLVASRLTLAEQASGAQADRADLQRLATIDESYIPRLNLILSVEGAGSASEAYRTSQIERSATANAEYQRLLGLRVREVGLRSIYRPEHPALKETEQSIQEIEDFLKNKSEEMEKFRGMSAEDLSNVYLRMLKDDLSGIEQRASELEGLARSEAEASRSFARAQAEEIAMRNRITRKQELYDQVVHRLSELSLIQDYGSYFTEIISPPQAGRKVWPNSLAVLFVGAIVGFVFGSGAALWVDATDHTFHSCREIAAALDAPVVACLRRFFASPLTRAAGAVGTPNALVAHFAPRSAAAEAFRQLCAVIPFEDRRVIVVASPHSGDGCTTVAANLAVSLAKTEKRVLFIDGDSATSASGKPFELKRHAGLSAVLQGELSLDAAIQPTAIPHLDAVASGPETRDHGSWFALARSDQILSQLREQYDCVIIDGPAVLELSASLLLAKRSDGVLLTLRVRKNGLPAAQQAKQLLDQAGASTVGLVVNDVDALLRHVPPGGAAARVQRQDTG